MPTDEGHVEVLCEAAAVQQIRQGDSSVASPANDKTMSIH